MASNRAVAVIVDLARSRTHPDRSALQRAVENAFDKVNTTVDALQPLAPTVGDEFQAAYPTVDHALHATLLARLHLPDGVDCRFGIGHGELRPVSTGSRATLQDGSAWWSAREALEEAEELERSRLPFARTRYRMAEDAPPTAPHPHHVNAYLTTRDHLVTSMSERERRLLLGQLAGATQRELAESEGISQSAVSQALRRSGATALLASESLLTEGER